MSLLVIMYNLRTLTKCLGCLFTQFLCVGGGGGVYSIQRKGQKLPMRREIVTFTRPFCLPCKL